MRRMEKKKIEKDGKKTRRRMEKKKQEGSTQTKKVGVEGEV